jgi:hypothetical protein
MTRLYANNHNDDHDESHGEETQTSVSYAQPSTTMSHSQDPEDMDTTDEENSMDDHNNSTHQALEHWRQSPFAVGFTKPTWKDEVMTFRDACLACTAGANRDTSSYICSAFLCSKLNAGRVGNMFVLRQRDEEYVLENGERKKRPRLICVAGPYWTFMAFITMPLILIVSAWTAFRKVNEVSIIVTFVWLFLLLGLVFSLLNVACRDPGIMYRCPERPPECDDWTWNDQALTFRPRNALYDPTCAVVVEEFDHTCPWTGTAIGKKNIMWFWAFQFFLFAALVLDIVLLILR